MHQSEPLSSPPLPPTPQPPPPPPPPPQLKMAPPQSPPEMPPPLQMEIEPQEFVFETPPPLPLHMETTTTEQPPVPSTSAIQTEIEPQQLPSQGIPLPLPPRLRMVEMPEQPPPPPPSSALSQMDIKPQEQIQLQTPPEQAPPPVEIEPQQAPPAPQEQPPPQTLPLPPETQQPSSSQTLLPPPGRRGAAAAAPILASINPSNQIIGPTQWSTSICGCHNDLRNCLITFFCPCITFGEISEIIDKGSSTCVMNGIIYGLLVALCGCACVYSCTYRDRMRRQFNLKGSNCGDCCVHLWCELCALCQEYRELKSRGFDLSKGWDANLELRSQGVMMPPSTPIGMRR